MMSQTQMMVMYLGSIWCTDDSYLEYDSTANTDDGSCYLSSIWYR